MDFDTLFGGYRETEPYSLSYVDPLLGGYRETEPTGSSSSYVDPLLIAARSAEPRPVKTFSEQEQQILAAINKDTGKPPTFADVYNRWVVNELLPWQNSVQGTETDLTQLKVDKNGYIIPTPLNPLWNWSTGADTQATKLGLDQRYLDALDAYNKANNTNIKPDETVLGATTQPNPTFRAADDDSFFVKLRDTAEAAGSVAGNYFLPGSSLVTSRLFSEGAQEQLATDEMRLANAAAGIAGGLQGNMANYGIVGEALGITTADPNAVGGITGPDNIDVGGGWSPAAGATPAELEAARIALESPGATGLETLPPSVNTPEQAFGGTPEVTADQITSDISANAPDNIDAGGGWSPATGATESELAAARAAAAATPAQVAAAKAAGMSVLDYARAGLLINALTGDPLGLGGETGQQGAPAGSTGFAQVPIPAEWKSPTYAASSAPIDLESIFSTQNMLGGTQWQNLPSQRNVSFNDIFAAGQQQTPMGSPVDLNNIVSAILGQTATSQKSA